jgi:hypothetical protein
MGGRVLAGKFTLACVVALCTSEASALTLMLYDAIPPLEQDIEACRTGQDRRLNKLTKDQRDEICIRAINEMERQKARLGAFVPQCPLSGLKAFGETPTRPRL